MAISSILWEDDRVELIEGDVVEMSPIGSSHVSQVLRLDAVLQRLVAGRAIVSVQNPVERSEPQPDVTLLRPRADFYAARHPRPADVLLLIEMADSSAPYDREVRLPLYARAGIPVAWLIDLGDRPGGVEVYGSPSASGYARATRHAGSETLAVPGVPELCIAVAELLG